MELKAVLGPPRANWLNSLDERSREAVTRAGIRNMTFDRYFQLNYDQDDDQLMVFDDEEEEEIPIEEYEKPPREFTDGELRILSRILSKLLSYNPVSRGTPETLRNALDSLGG